MRAWLILVFSSVCLLAADPEFTAIPTKPLVTCFVLSEDGHWLALAQPGKNQVAIWDVAKRKIVHAIECPTPTWMVWRGEELYVANGDKASISVFHEGSWAPDDVIQIGEAITYLSAPHGKHFADQIFAAGDQHVLLVDVHRDTHRILADSHLTDVLTVSADGTTALTYVPYACQDLFKLHTLPDFLTHFELPWPVHGPRARGLIEQCQDGEFWVGDDGAYAGKMPTLVLGGDQEIDSKLKRFAIMDTLAPRIYIVSIDRIDAYAMKPGLPHFGTWLNVDCPLLVDRAQPAENLAHGFRPPGQAVTSGGTTTFFLPREEEDDHWATVVTSVFTVSLPADPDIIDLPTVATVGQAVSGRVSCGDSAGTCTILTGPSSVRVDDHGRITWTPTRDELGSQTIKVRAVFHGKTSFNTFTTEVVAVAPADPNGPTVASKPADTPGPMANPVPEATPVPPPAVPSGPVASTPEPTAPPSAVIALPLARAATAPRLADLDALMPALEGADLSPVDLAKRTRDSVVLIEHSLGFGTGFFVGNGGYLLTCAHVVPNEAGTVQVTYQTTVDGITVLRCDPHPQLVLADPRLDLALYKISPVAPVQSVHFGPVGLADLGEHVFVIGNPAGAGTVLSSTMTDGLISSPFRLIDGQGYIQISAPVNPGNSGSPLFNPHGAVIGLVVLKAMDAEATGFAIPNDRLEGFLRRAAMPEETPLPP
jgi:serine protease Do